MKGIDIEEDDEEFDYEDNFGDDDDGFEFKDAAQWLCTDNAAMIVFAALLRLQAGLESKVTEEIDPNLALAG